MRRVPVAFALVALLVLSFPAFAGASQLLARDASGPKLRVNAAGVALITYTKANGKQARVLASGGIDALPPSEQGRQVRLTLDYSGGWKTRGKAVRKRFVDSCAPYGGPELAWFVAGCTAPDGSHWALQSWQRSLPYHGGPASNRFHYTRELRLSHFTGELAQIEVFHDWMHSNRFHELFGRVTFRGTPVHGFPKKRFPGADQGFARRIYTDTFNSGYGPGWWRADSLRTHHSTGTFCVLLAQDLTDRWGTNRGWGERYRIVVEGPGVTPDVVWEGDALPAFDPLNATLVEHERAMETVRRSLDPPDRRCRFA